jgi:hypothetical protein
MTGPEPRRILIATVALEGPSGTELYTRDLALGLLRRGCLPIVYTPLMGRLAQELRAASIPVVDNVDAIGGTPDVIHGHHYLETLAAIARFPAVPALFVAHDAYVWISTPPSLPSLRTYVAVDRNCRDRIVFEHGVPEAAVRVLTNAVDLARFPRRGPLPEKPRRALIFSNVAAEYTSVAPIRAACEQRGIAVDVIGNASGHPTDKPEALLPQYDLVFGKGRAALEAAASGAAVIVSEYYGVGGMLTTASLDAMRQLNLGMRTLQRPLTAENILVELDRYDAGDAAAVTDRIRASADLDVLLDQYLALYDELIAAPAAVTAEETLRAVASELSSFAPQLYGRRGAISSASSLKRKLLNWRPAGPVLRFLYRTGGR